jgi:peptide/nickel transport system permease protein
MFAFLRRRLVLSLITLLGVSVVAFGLARLTGSPALLYLPEGSSPAMFAAFNHQHGYDRPLIVQFAGFLRDLCQLRFGQSLSQQRPAATAILDSMPPTLLLAGVALAISLVLGVVLGVLAAMKPFARLDRAITLASLAAASVPDFWFALVGVLFLAVQLRLVPTSGEGGLTSWILPVATLAIAPAGVLTQIVRGAMLEALTSGYVQNARARGFGRWRIAFRHALRNAALPIITVAGDRAVHLFNGTIIVGTIFAWPGVGSVVVSAVLARDFALLQAAVFMIGVAVIILNIIVDVIYAFADPRIRVS